MDEGWIQQMGVRRLSRGPSQPFYNVLGDDGSCRYAAQGKWQPDLLFVNMSPVLGLVGFMVGPNQMLTYAVVVAISN